MSTHEEAQVRNVIDDWVAALRAKDVSRVTSHHAKEVMQFTLGAEELQFWFDNWKDPFGYEIHDLAVVGGDNVAFSHSLNRMTATSVDGKEADLWFRLTLGFRKTGSTWKIVHVHESVPFYMDGSYRAAVDFKP